MGNLQNSYVKLDKVSKIYKMGEVNIEALSGVNFSEYSWWNGHSDKRKCFCGWQQHCEI